MASVPQEHVNKMTRSHDHRRLHTVAEAKARLLEAGEAPWSAMLMPIILTTVEKATARIVSRVRVPKNSRGAPVQQDHGVCSAGTSNRVERTREEQRAWNVRKATRIASNEKVIGICIQACELAFIAWRKRRAAKKYEASKEQHTTTGTEQAPRSFAPAPAPPATTASAGLV